MFVCVFKLGSGFVGCFSDTKVIGSILEPCKLHASSLISAMLEVHIEDKKHWDQVNHAVFLDRYV